MLRFDVFVIFVSESTRFALFPTRVKTDSGNRPDIRRRLTRLPRHVSGVEMIAVVIERGSRISQRPASTRAMKSPQV